MVIINNKTKKNIIKTNNNNSKKINKIKNIIKDKDDKNKHDKNKHDKNKDDKNIRAIKLTENDLYERGIISNNDDEIKIKYPKIHPITNKKIYKRGYYWENFNLRNKNHLNFENNGYYEKFDEEFDKLDKEYVNMFDKTGKIKILAYYNELDILCTGIKNFDKEINGLWFLAPEGYYWKWCHEKCYFNFDWVELEKI